MFSLKEWICRGLPKPVSEEDVKRNRKRLIRRIVANVSRGNVSLSQGRFITTEDVEQMRQKNQKHDFCKNSPK